jgi:hypothetical protein
MVLALVVQNAMVRRLGCCWLGFLSLFVSFVVREESPRPSVTKGRKGRLAATQHRTAAP